MATLDEIFASMPDEAAEGVHDLLIIDPEARTIDVPQTESIFGVENDGRAETKYFKSPRYVGNGIDLAACFLRVNFQNANGDRDGHQVNDLEISGDYVHFSWELSKKVTQYKGVVQFVICANLPGSTKVADWHTTLAQGTVLEGLEPDAAAVEAASSDVIAQLLQLVTSQTEAVEAAGAAQVAKVQTEGSTQVGAVKAAAAQAEADAVAEIEAKKQNALAELPADYTAMGNQVDALTRSTAGAIVCAAEGETIQVHDASGHHLHGLRIFGRSTQDGTPTPDAPVEIVSTPAPTVGVLGKNLLPANEVVNITRNGVTYTPKYDQFGRLEYITASGTSTELSYCVIASRMALPAGDYILNGCPAGGGDGKYEIRFNGLAGRDDGEGMRFTITEETAQNSITCVVAAGVTVDDLRFKPMIRLASIEDATYEPYVTRGAVQTANDLPGIPVESGGNYTDANGQQWICDEVDLSRGVYVQRTIAITAPEFSADTTDVFSPTGGLTEGSVALTTKEIKQGVALCTHFLYQQGGNAVRFAVLQNGRAYFTLPGEYSAIEWRQKMIELAPTVIVCLSEPMETPLSETELAAWRNLRSNKPTTTLLNDSGAHMAVEYVADTKLYIDRKIAELVAATTT